MRWARARSRRTSVGRWERVSCKVRGVRWPPSDSKLRRLDKHYGPAIMRPVVDSGAAPRSPTGPSGTRGDRHLRGPAPTEAGWMDLHVFEAKNAERGRDPLRLQVELPEVREDPARFVAAFDAVPLVVPSDVAARAVVPSAGEAEEAIRHVTRSADRRMGFRVAGGKGYFQPPCSRHPCRSAPALPCSRTKGSCRSTTSPTRWSIGKRRPSGSSACSAPSWKRGPR